MNRVDFLPDSYFIERIADLEKQLAELNTYQRLGSHNTLSQRLFSSNTYDVQLTNIAIGATVPITVTFTPSSTLFNNLSLVHRLMYTYTSSSSPSVSLERFLPTGNQQTWKIYVNNNSGLIISTVQIKLYLFVIGSGTFTAV